MRWWCSEVISSSSCMPSGAAPAVACCCCCFSNKSINSVGLQFQRGRRSPFLKFNFSLRHRKLLAVQARLRLPSRSTIRGEEDDYFDFVVINFYQFLSIKDPRAQVVKHLSFLHLEDLDIKGRIYLSEQGINAQFSGPSKDAMAYVNWLKQDKRFSDIMLQISPSQNGHSFPTLKLRYKPSLVQFDGGISHLPLLDPSVRAIPLAPSEWRGRLEAINKSDLPSKDYPNRNYVLLDVRNGYEWDIGHFRGAQRPNVDCFRSTSFGLSKEQITASDPLSNVDKEKAIILMYCTGGIRCDVYSTILRQQGFQNLYTLKGGVSHYLKSEGPAEWVGNLFVFDSRLSLPPPVYDAWATAEAEATPVSGDDRECAKDLRGCCCATCTTAPRLRPVLNGDQRYKKWHIYRDMDLQDVLTPHPFRK